MSGSHASTEVSPVFFISIPMTTGLLSLAVTVLLLNTIPKNWDLDIPEGKGRGRGVGGLKALQASAAHSA